jgi:hypothetical protein
MAALDLTVFNDALKEWYTPRRVQNMVYKENPFLALVPKSTKFPGSKLPIPIIYGNPTSTSALFTTAQTQASTASNGSGTKVDRFELTRVKRYGVAIVDGETMKATESDEGAFLKALKTEVDGVIHQLKRNLAVQLYRGGWGEIGSIGAISSSVITLTKIEDVTNFEVGQQVVFSDEEATVALRSATAVRVTAVDRSLGKVTIASTPGGVVATDYIFLDGDREDAASPTRRCIAGLEAWAPATAPTSTAFFGSDRSVDVTRLGGQRVVGTSAPLEEVLIDGAVMAGREGFAPKHAFMSYGKWASLEKALMGKVKYETVKATADIAFEAIVVNGPRGPIKCIADQNCPSNRIWLCNFDNLKLHSLGEMIRTINDDGNMLMRQAAADGVESRHGFYGNLACDAPGSLVNIQV